MFLLASVLCLASCSVRTPQGVAVVDWFDYQGQDDFDGDRCKGVPVRDPFP